MRLGLITGVIVRIDTNSLSVTPVAKIGEHCDEQYEESMTLSYEGFVCYARCILRVLDAHLTAAQLGTRRRERFPSNLPYE